MGLSHFYVYEFVYEVYSYDSFVYYIQQWQNFEVDHYEYQHTDIVKYVLFNDTSKI